MEVIKNRRALERKQFLMIALEKGNITQEKYDSEMPALEKEIAMNLQEALIKCGEALKADMQNVAKTIISDGDMKRGIAKILIKFLEKDFNNSELKGIFRQGYKLMRARE